MHLVTMAALLKHSSNFLLYSAHSWRLTRTMNYTVIHYYAVQTLCHSLRGIQMVLVSRTATNAFFNMQIIILSK